MKTFVLAIVLATLAAAEDKPKTTEEQLAEAKKTIAEQDKAVQWLKAKVDNLNKQLQGLSLYCSAATASAGLDRAQPAEPKETTK